MSLSSVSATPDAHARELAAKYLEAVEQARAEPDRADLRDAARAAGEAFDQATLLRPSRRGR